MARMSGASNNPQQAEIATKAVAMQRRREVLVAAGAAVQAASRAHAWRFRRYKIQPAATATIAAIVSGQ